jgi:hypothetical protein
MSVKTEVRILLDNDNVHSVIGTVFSMLEDTGTTALRVDIELVDL